MPFHSKGDHESWYMCKGFPDEQDAEPPDNVSYANNTAIAYH